MSLAEVRLWGSLVGAVNLAPGEATAAFEYSDAFIRRGVEISPLAMPLARTVYRFSALNRDTFHGLPGLLADSLPDRFGNAVIDAWLAGQGRSPGSMDAVERLCYTGTRGMGALEYQPATFPEAGLAERLEVGELARLAAEMLSSREGFSARLPEGFAQILRVGTSAGGARAKAVIAWNESTGEIRSGQADMPPGFSPWLLKFDGIGDSSTGELGKLDELGAGGHFGRIEYAYHLMAVAAGIHMSECRLFEEGGRAHFMTRRFDRDASGRKLHMQSLGALAHLDYNMPGAASYEQAFLAARRLGLAAGATEEIFRRMMFNAMARNQDDHVKNLAFLMGRDGAWELAPAYDLTHSHNPASRWTSRHQMTINGKSEDFTRDDFRSAAGAAGLVRGRDGSIAEEVRAALGRWPEFAAHAGLPEAQTAAIGATFRS